MNKLDSLSIFFPAYNDALSIPLLIKKADSTAKIIAKKYEILIINDGSKDATSEVVKKLQKQYKYLKLIEHKKNKGYGAALLSGFENARYTWVFYTDGDGQYDPGELHSLVDKVSPTIDIVNGYKLNREDALIRKVIGIVYVHTLRMLYHPPIKDIDCDFRLMRNTFLKNIKLRSHSGLICLELVVKLQQAGAKFTEVGVHHYERKYGSSQFFHPKHLFTTLLEHIRFYVLWKKNPIQLELLRR